MKTMTAPMGWNSWDCYGAAVTEDIVRKNADFMAKHLKKYGWEYITVDIQWYEPNAKTHEYTPFAKLCIDEYSRVIPAENRFPSSAGGKGFAPLAEYVHSLGLKFGIHIMRGIPRQAVYERTKIKGTDKTAADVAKTDSICAWNTDMYGVDPAKPGAKEYYDSIFELYASWGVDFVKCDDIARELPKEESELIMLSDSLKNCGRDMVLSLSPGPALLEKAELYKQVSNMWRITDDFWDNWQLLYNMFERCEKWAPHNGAGHWADADMLPIGPMAQRAMRGTPRMSNFTPDEQYTMLTLWAMFRSPLMIGCNLPEIDDFTLNLITNKEVLDINQYSKGNKELFDRNGIIAWYAQSEDELTHYIAIFNTTDKDIESYTFPLQTINYIGDGHITDLWKNESMEIKNNSVSFSVPAHGVKLIKLTK